MDNIKLVIVENAEYPNNNLDRIFKDRFSEPIAKIYDKAFVLFFQRDHKPRNRYNAKIYCDGDEEIHGKIFTVINQSGWDIEVEPFVY